MIDLAEYVKLTQKLEELELVIDKLMPNELELLRSIEAKYAEPLSPDPFDATALFVMLRNVDVRRAYQFDPKKDGGRVIDLPRSDALKKARRVLR